MITRFALVALASFISAKSDAEEYVLRLETSGYRNIADDSKGDDKLLDSIEVIAKADETFFGKAAMGESKITISGKLKKMDDGRFRVTLRYRFEEPSGQFVPGPSGTKLPISTSTIVSTDIIVEPNKTANLGRQETANRNLDGKSVKTKIESVLKLTKFDLSTVQ
ncbi:MAG: hypothetical protein U0930_10040 [Pirellulales bacterium]